MSDQSGYPVIEFSIPPSVFHTVDREVETDFGVSLVTMASQDKGLAYAIVRDSIIGAGCLLPTYAPAFDLIIRTEKTRCTRQSSANRQRDFCGVVMKFTVEN